MQTRNVAGLTRYKPFTAVAAHFAAANHGKLHNRSRSLRKVSSGAAGPMPTRLPPIPPFAFDVTLPFAHMSGQGDVSGEYEVQFRVLFCQMHSFMYSSVSQRMLRVSYTLS